MNPQDNRRALVLLGHGSHFNAQSSLPVYRHAAAIRERGWVHEVRVGFWKEEPSLARCLDGLDVDEAVVVPLFMSSGYFTQEVIPREMGLEGNLTRRDGMTIRYTAPVGVCPGIADLVAGRAREAGADPGTAVVVLGHGTSRNANSEETIYRQAERLARRGEFAEVIALFLDQAPRMTEVWSRTGASRVVVVPMFLSDGWHVDETIPGDLDLDHGRASRDGRELVITPAVGTHPRIVEMIEELSAPEHRGVLLKSGGGAILSSSPVESFLETLMNDGECVFGEVTVVKREKEYVLYGPGQRPAVSEPDFGEYGFGGWIRQTGSGQYRPLSGLRDMRSGWMRTFETVGDLSEALDTVYPLALQHLHQQATGTLRITSAAEVLGRQGGRSRSAADLDACEQQAATRVLCGQCVRCPLWAGATLEEAHSIPCPEPCSLWVSLCREAVTWRGAEPGTEDFSIGAAEFGREGNRFKEAYLRSNPSRAD